MIPPVTGAEKYVTPDGRLTAAGQILLQEIVKAVGTNETDITNNETDIANLAAPMMGIYFSTPAQTTISGAGTYVKAAGTTTVTNASGYMSADSVNNRIKYTRAGMARHFHIVAQASVEIASGTNQDIGVQVYHYDDSAVSGSLLAHSEARSTIPNTNITQITTHADVQMDENDYLELWVANNTSTINCTVQFGYLFVTGLKDATE